MCGCGGSSSRVHGLYGGGPQVSDRRREVSRTPSGRSGPKAAPCGTPRSGPSTAELGGNAGRMIGLKINQRSICLATIKSGSISQCRGLPTSSVKMKATQRQRSVSYE